MKPTYAAIIAPAALLALGACNTISFTPASKSTSGANVVIGATAATTTVNGVALSDMTTPGGLTTPGYTNTYNSTDRYAFVGRTASGEMASALVATTGAATPMNFVAYSRTTAGELPTSGTASMTGKYVSMIGPTAGTELSNSLISYASGDANVTANFASNAVSGVITNRLVGGSPTADITLTAAPIASDGTYAGTAVSTDLGGSLPGVSGSYQGMLGANGTETAGAVKFLYSNGGTNYAELGAFYAE